MSYKMILLMLMSERADASGTVRLQALAEDFQQLFVTRSLDGKSEENPNRLKPGTMARRTTRKWKQVLREQPVHYLTESFVIDEASTIRWAPRIWN